MSDHLFELYSQKILQLATEIPMTAPIEKVDAQAKKRSPICGSEVEVFLTLDQDQITDYSQIVNACALGQASSAIFAQNVIGRTKSELEALRDQLQTFLKGEGSAPSGAFQGYEVLEPAQKHRNRHASIMLPVETSLQAFENAQSK